MATIEFNKEGTPLMISGSSFVSSTTGAPAPSASRLTVELEEGTSTVGKAEFSNWGAANDFPQIAEGYISQSTVLRSALKYKYLLTIGQGLYPVRVLGYDNNGNEQVEVHPDAKVKKFLRSRMVRAYYEKALRDSVKFGLGAAQLIPSPDYSKMVGISTFNMKYSRLSPLVKGEIKNLVYSGAFPNSPSAGDFDTYRVLRDYDPDAALVRRMAKKQGKAFAYMLRDNFSGMEIYGMPDWWTAKEAGWLDVIKKVPKFLLNAYDNAMYIKWHIKIPYQYWDKKFPSGDFKDTKDRQNKISEYMNDFEKALTSTENAHKAVFTMYETISGKVEEQWVIEPLDSKVNFDKDLATSAAGNSEILFSLMVNPSVMGAGMPGGPYSGNAGSGSDIREAFLVNIALAWADRQKMNDPLEMYLNFNGADDVEIRSRNTLLTTLDTGSGTTKTLS